MYRYILFDLDGTLTDPGAGITNSVAYALEKYNIIVEDKTELYKFVGPPLQESFQKFYGFSEEQSLKAVEYYREYFRVTGIYENEVYDGIEEMLFSLKKAGKHILLATSKPEEFAEKILEHFQLDKYFDYTAGAAMDGTRVKKGEIIQYAIDHYPIERLSEAVMVGDREHDIIGARQTGIDSIGVLYGYGDDEELRKAGATYIANGVKEILKLLK